MLCFIQWSGRKDRNFSCRPHKSQGILSMWNVHNCYIDTSKFILCQLFKADLWPVVNWLGLHLFRVASAWVISNFENVLDQATLPSLMHMNFLLHCRYLGCLFLFLIFPQWVVEIYRSLHHSWKLCSDSSDTLLQSLLAQEANRAFIGCELVTDTSYWKQPLLVSDLKLAFYLSSVFILLGAYFGFPCSKKTVQSYSEEACCLKLGCFLSLTMI